MSDSRIDLARGELILPFHKFVGSFVSHAGSWVGFMR